MAQVLIRNIDPDLLERLKARARRSRRSLQAELTHILEQAIRFDYAEARAVAGRIRESLAGRAHSDSGVLQAEDRER